MNDSPFRTYEVTSVETRTIATITEQNIGQIAALVKGAVDYSGTEPFITEPNKTMRWRVGMDVSLSGDHLNNQSGFKTGSRVTKVREVQPEETT